MVIPRRRLGRSAIQVSPFCLGGNVFGWTIDEATSFRILDGFVDAGFEFIDTADAYSAWVPGHVGGESESILGKWIQRRGRHDDLVIATKVGYDLGGGRKGLKRDYILRSAEDSLRRLKIDCIDLYQSHRDDLETPMEETLEAYAQLIKQGKVRVIGASNFTAERLTQALETSQRLGLPRYESLQPLYNLHDRIGFEERLAPLCRAQEIGVINFYSLAAGFLTGKYRSAADVSKSARGNKALTYLDPRGLKILSALDQISARISAKPGQIAMAWLLTRPEITAPIASATSLEQLNELVAAVRLKLDAEALALLQI